MYRTARPAKIKRYYQKAKFGEDGATFITLDDGEIVNVREIDASSNSKYVIPLLVGDLAPSDVVGYRLKMLKNLEEFFGEGMVLLVPVRKIEDFALYEIQEH